MSEQHPGGAWSPRRDEPAVHSAALQAYVDAAKAAPVREPTVSFETVRSGVEARLHQRRMAMGLGAVGVAAAVLLAFNFNFDFKDRVESDRSATIDATPAGAVVASNVDTKHDDSQAEAAQLGTEPVLDAVTPVLADGIELAPGDATVAPVILDTNAARLGRGTYAVAVEPRGVGAPAVELTFDDAVGEARTLVVQHGRLSIDAADGAVIVRLESGVAAWRDAGGLEVSIDLVTQLEGPGEAETKPEPKVASASELARQADYELAVGKRGAAIRSLRQLVTQHAKAPESRTGLLDLAGLLKASGRTDEARCAYALYLDRWPKGALAGDVERSLERLGEGPACRGLHPKKD